MAYLSGRNSQVQAGDVAGALAAYAQVPQTSRFWSQATYLSGLIQVERGAPQGRREPLLQGRRPEARRTQTAPFFADERLLRGARSRAARARPRRARAVPLRRRALLLLPRAARLRPPRRSALRVGDHALREEGLRRRARAARRAQGARRAPSLRGRSVDPRRVHRSRAAAASTRPTRSSTASSRAYEPVRDAARRLATDDRGTRALLAAARTGCRRRRHDARAHRSRPMQLRADRRARARRSALRQVDAKRARRSSSESSGLRLRDRARSTTCSAASRRPAACGRTSKRSGDPCEKAHDARAALDGVRRQIDDLEQAKRAPAEDRAAPQGARRDSRLAARARERAAATRRRGPSRQGRSARSPPRRHRARRATLRRARSTARGRARRRARRRSRRTRCAASICGSRGCSGARASVASSRCSAGSARSRSRSRRSPPAICRRTALDSLDAAALPERQRRVLAVRRRRLARRVRRRRRAALRHAYASIAVLFALVRVACILAGICALRRHGLPTKRRPRRGAGRRAGDGFRKSSVKPAAERTVAGGGRRTEHRTPRHDVGEERGQAAGAAIPEHLRKALEAQIARRIERDVARRRRCAARRWRSSRPS